jgi:hypothetical protein
MGRGTIKFLLKDGRIITLLGFFYILYLSNSPIFVSKFDDAVGDTLLGKVTWNMVRGEMELMRGVLVYKYVQYISYTHLNVNPGFVINRVDALYVSITDRFLCLMSIA